MTALRKDFRILREIYSELAKLGGIQEVISKVPLKAPRPPSSRSLKSIYRIPDKWPDSPEEQFDIFRKLARLLQEKLAKANPDIYMDEKLIRKRIRDRYGKVPYILDDIPYQRHVNTPDGKTVVLENSLLPVEHRSTPSNMAPSLANLIMVTSIAGRRKIPFQKVTAKMSPRVVEVADRSLSSTYLGTNPTGEVDRVVNDHILAVVEGKAYPRSSTFRRDLHRALIAAEDGGRKVRIGYNTNDFTTVPGRYDPFDNVIALGHEASHHKNELEEILNNVEEVTKDFLAQSKKGKRKRIIAVPTGLNPDIPAIMHNEGAMELATLVRDRMIREPRSELNADSGILSLLRNLGLPIEPSVSSGMFSHAAKHSARLMNHPEFPGHVPSQIFVKEGIKRLQNLRQFGAVAVPVAGLAALTAAGAAVGASIYSEDNDAA